MTSSIMNFSVTFGISKVYGLNLDLYMYRLGLFAHNKVLVVHIRSKINRITIQGLINVTMDF